MRNYEVILVVDASIPSEEVEAEINKFKEIIKSKGGKTSFESAWGRRKLAYEINKKKHGFYHLMYVAGNQEVIEELERQAGYDDKTLKLFVVRVDDLEASHTQFEVLKETPLVRVNQYIDAAQGE